MSDPSQWLGLLRWSMKYQDGTGTSNFKPMSEEDKKWLEAALSEMLVDETKLIVERVETLKAENEKESVDADLVQDIQDELEDILGQVDRARDLHKLKKLADLAALLRSRHVAIRRVSCSLIATVAQNNPFIQEACIDPDMGIIHSVTHMVVHDPDESVRLRALSALSCIIRSYEPALALFLDEGDGMRVVCHAVSQSEHGDIGQRRQKKALHLLHALVFDSQTARKHVGDAPVLETLLNLIGGLPSLPEENGGLDHDIDSAETVLQLLLTLVELTPEIWKALDSLSLPQIVQRRIAALDALPGDLSDEIKIEKDLLHQLSKVMTKGPHTLLEERKAAEEKERAAVRASSSVRTTVFSTPGERAPNEFIPTHEFQEVLPGQSIPPGLHVRLNMQTGVREARLMDPSQNDDHLRSQLLVVNPDEPAVVVPQPQSDSDMQQQ